MLADASIQNTTARQGLLLSRRFRVLAGSSPSFVVSPLDSRFRGNDTLFPWR